MKAIVDFKLNTKTISKNEYALMCEASQKPFLDIEDFELFKHNEISLISSNFESIVIDANRHINQIHIRETASQYKCFKKKDIITSNNQNIIHIREEAEVNNILHYIEKEKVIISLAYEKKLQKKMFKLRNKIQK